MAITMAAKGAFSVFVWGVTFPRDRKHPSASVCDSSVYDSISSLVILKQKQWLNRNSKR